MWFGVRGWREVNTNGERRRGERIGWEGKVEGVRVNTDLLEWGRWV